LQSSIYALNNAGICFVVYWYVYHMVEIIYLNKAYMFYYRFFNGSLKAKLIIK